MTWKNISELKNTEHRKDIYVLGSGKSLDYINSSFFDGKVTIGIGNLYRLVKCKYYVTKEKESLEQRIAAHTGIQIVSEYRYGNIQTQQLNQVPSKKPYYYFEHKTNDHSLHLEELDSDRIIVSWATVNTALHIAYFLGARNIILAGCDCGAIDDNYNAIGYRYAEEPAPPPSDQWYGKWLNRISDDIAVLACALRKRGIGVISLNPFVNFKLEGHTYK